MKTFFKTVTAAVLLAAASAPVLAQQLSPAVIVIVDMDRVVNESAAGKTAGTEIQTKITNLQSRAATLQTQLKTDADSIQAGQANKTLVGPALEQRAQAFGQKQQQAQQEIARLEQDIARSRQYVIQQISTAASPIITQVMRERNASIALQKEATLQHSASLEVTNDVITRLNTSTPRVSTTPPAQPAPAAAAPRQ
ncbi:OmpH family outer membrane protein [Sandaracinobacteroides hominis]|uniref:OmpH family outer membrane protein n=1 Tax=Sandaracinobacteroides hominis TaxID=2780086 RepID=UPI0018F2D2C5|nr:OmpH family outer membrane protein [Sandaracinobacteroides hominis]